MNYQTVVSFDSNLRDVRFTDADTLPTALQGLVIEGVYVVTGSPAVVAGKYMPGAKVFNAVDSTWYINSGTTVSPTWTLVDAGTVGITALTGDVTASGTGSVVATIAAKAVTGAKLSTGVGYFTVAKATNGTTPVNVIGATVPFGATITDVYVTSLDTTAGNITIADTAGTIATIAKGTTAGVMTGATSLANTTITSGNTLTIVSSSAGNANVKIVFTVA